MDVAVSAENRVLFDDDRVVRKFIPVTGHWFSPERSFWGSAKTWFRLLAQVRKDRYDAAVDFRGDLRHILLMAFAGIPIRIGYGVTGGGFLLTHKGRPVSDRHQVLSNAELLKFLGVPPDVRQEPFTYSGERKRRFWNLYGNILGPAVPSRRIVVHAGAGYPSKRWPLDAYRRLILKMVDAELGQVVLIGTEREKVEGPSFADPNPYVVDLRGRTRLSDLPILFDACHVFVGNDSGPAHIAAAQGIETVVLFSGTNDYRVWHPWTKKLHLIRCEVPCSPCGARVCPLRHHDCMEKLRVEDVFEKLKALCGQTGSRPYYRYDSPDN
jgi:ADP-heptose:LPS heptosyltransferase